MQRASGLERRRGLGGQPAKAELHDATLDQSSLELRHAGNGSGRRADERPAVGGVDWTSVQLLRRK
jgi:hypothetical protein